LALTVPFKVALVEPIDDATPVTAPCALRRPRSTVMSEVVPQALTSGEVP